MQSVKKAMTKLGTFGYFTGTYLVWSLSKGEFEMSEVWHDEKCKALGFNYLGQHCCMVLHD